MRKDIPSGASINLIARLTEAREYEVQHFRPIAAIVLRGVNGVGKGTLSRLLLKEPSLNLHKFVRHTTRFKGEEEVDGIDYHFTDDQTFEEKIAKDDFVHWTRLSLGYYGEEITQVAQAMDAGKIMLFDLGIDTGEGLLQRFNLLGIPYVDFFISPVDQATLRSEEGVEKAVGVVRSRMLRRRRGESDEELAIRLNKARGWFANADNFGIYITNSPGQEAKAVEQILTCLQEISEQRQETEK